MGYISWLRRSVVSTLFGLVSMSGCAWRDIDQLPALQLTQINDHVYSAIGATTAPSYENWGHNNNLSVVIGSRGVLVVNGGDNYLLARALHQQIRQITHTPVRWLVNENGQGHAFLGNSYWREQGVQIIAHEDAATEIHKHGTAAMVDMRMRSGERGAHTFVAPPDETFDDGYEIDLGGCVAKLIRFGEAHSPGDISVWLPHDATLIAGDIAFHQRLLGIFPDTDVLAWIASLEQMRAMPARTIIPGHGVPTQPQVIERETYAYLTYLVDRVNEVLENDGDLSDAYAIDQSAYAHLNTFEELAVKNAGRVFQQLELNLFD